MNDAFLINCASKLLALNPTVSVIVPCYNLGNYIYSALESVLLQSFSDWECIIVNDGSTDNTEEIALHFCRLDKRFIYLKQNNKGLSHARNSGLAKATGEYLQFLDADDWIASTKLEKQLSSLRDTDTDVVMICDHEPFDDSTKKAMPEAYMSPFLDARNFKKEVITEWQFRKSIPCHNFLIPAKIISNHSLRFTEVLPNHEDWVFWCQVLYFAKAVGFQPEKLAFYRMRSDSMSQNRQKMAEGFLLACNFLHHFFLSVNDRVMIKEVAKIKKEIQNNLFPHGPYLKLMGVLSQSYRLFFPKSQQRV